MLDRRVNDRTSQLQQLYDEMEPLSLKPLWEVLATLVLPEPRSPARAHGWSYASVRDHLMRAGDLISAEEAERRVLILENPGLPGSSGATGSLYAGLQLILPGEIAPCHRHVQCALRFVLEGEGAYTAVDGEKAVMSAFDLVLTPGWRWHDHGNPTDRPMIWLDGLDIPTVRFFDASFAERFGGGAHPETAPTGDSSHRYGRNMRPFRADRADGPAQRSLFHYPYSQWRESLEAAASASDPDPHLGHALEFINPADGGSVMSTIAAHVRKLPRGFQSRERRATDGTVFVVVEGEGRAMIGHKVLELSAREIFVAPAWAPVRFRAESDLVLFGYSDRAAQEKLGLYREARA